MAQWNANNNSSYQTQLILTQQSQNVANNTSVVRRVVRVVKLKGSGYWNRDATSSWSITGGGNKSGWFSYDFRNYTTLTLLDDTVTVTHNDNGSGSITCSASVSLNGIGSASVSGTLTLSTIPRASTISSVSGNQIGGTITVNINRKYSGFTHTLMYRYPNKAWVNVGTNIGTSVSFTLPMNDCSNFPNSTSGNLELSLQTYSGSTKVGAEVRRNHTVNVPSSVVPYVNTLSVSENESNVSSLIGTYVQGKSRAKVTASNYGGSYGSTIKSIRITGPGLSITTNSGVSSYLSKSGTNSFTVVVTDSRGRTASRTTSINVLAYSTPNIASFSAIRTNSTGSSVWNGTFVNAKWSVSVKSLVNGNQKNRLKIYLDHRVNGVSSWTNYRYIDNGSDINSNTNSINGTFDVTKGYDIRIRVVDVFGSTAEYIVAVPSGTIALDIGEQTLGVGKFWERGTIDAIGQIYQNDGIQVVNGYVGQLPSGDVNKGNYWRSLKPGQYRTGDASHLTNHKGAWGIVMVLRDLGNQFFDKHTRVLWMTDPAYIHYGTVNQTDDNMDWVTILSTKNAADFVIQQGSNYTKWNSGKLEVWGSATATYNQARYLAVTVNYPVAFSSNPIFTLTQNSTWTSDTHTYSNAMGSTSTTQLSIRCYTTPMANWSSGHTQIVYYTAVGKWK